MSENPKAVMVATPMYGGMCTGFYVQGLLEAVSQLNALGVHAFWSQLGNESLITRARNELVRLFLEGECTHLVFIDADIAFRGVDVLNLLASDKDVVCGLYPKKEVDWPRIAEAAIKGHTQDLVDFGGAFVLNPADKQHLTKQDRAKGLMEVRHGGTGFMMVKRKVFDKLKDFVPTYRTTSARGGDGEYLKPLTHEFFATSIDGNGALLSEDYHFCELWRKHGGRVYAAPFIQLGHVGTYLYGGDIVKAGANLK